MIKGENILIKKRLKDANNLDLLVSSLVSAKVRLNGVQYVLGVASQLRQGSATNELEFEITKAISGVLPLGKLTIEFEIEVPNADFNSDLNQVDIFRETIIIE